MEGPGIFAMYAEKILRGDGMAPITYIISTKAQQK
jgi:hypothetical protein